VPTRPGIGKFSEDQAFGSGKGKMSGARRVVEQGGEVKQLIEMTLKNSVRTSKKIQRFTITKINF
jgi:hypothetical protein